MTETDNFRYDKSPTNIAPKPPINPNQSTLVKNSN